MADSTDQLAHRVLAENLRVRKGENVLIESWTHSLPYARAFVREARRLGARPTVLYEDEEAYWDSVTAGNFGPWSNLSKAERSAVENADVYVYFWGPADRPRFEKLPPKVQNKVTGYNDEWYKIAGKAGLRGVRMNLGMASDENARTFGREGPAWREQFVRAGTVDAKTLLTKGRRLAKAIEGGKELRLHQENGTDLTLRLGQVHTRVDVGMVDAAAMKRPFGMMTNNPSGQVFAAIDGGHAEGTVVSNRGVYLNNVLYDGVRWTLSDGRLTARSIGSGRETFEKAFSKAPKGKDQLGLVSIGLNPEGREMFPSEDSEEGAVLLGVGNNAFVGGKIKIPFQGYTMVGESDVEVDGTPVVRGGKVL